MKSGKGFETEKNSFLIYFYHSNSILHVFFA
jgi:hypothetical protein